MRVLSLIPSGDNCGWGVCGKNLAEQLPKICDVVAIDGGEYDAILAPVTNHNWGYPPEWQSLCEAARRQGKPVVGYGFHEFRQMGSDSIHRLVANYDALACGSTWMKDWVVEALNDVKATLPVSVVFQGVDRRIFYPKAVERPEFMQGKYIVAVTGKLEFRKGQDIVIESFRRFLKQVPDAILTAAIDNPWIESALSLNESKWVKLDDIHLMKVGGAIFIAGIDAKIIPHANQTMWRMGPNSEMADFYRCADLVVFANRCEAGQTLGLLEAMAVGTPVIFPDWNGMSDAADVALNMMPVCLLEQGKRINTPGMSYGFYEPCVDEVLSKMMKQYHWHLDNSKSATKELAVNSMVSSMEFFNWRHTATGLVDLIRKVVK